MKLEVLIFQKYFYRWISLVLLMSKPKDDIIAQTTCVTTITQTFNFSLPTNFKTSKRIKDKYIITYSKVIINL